MSDDPSLLREPEQPLPFDDARSPIPFRHETVRNNPVGERSIRKPEPLMLGDLCEEEAERHLKMLGSSVTGDHRSGAIFPEDSMQLPEDIGHMGEV